MDVTNVTPFDVRRFWCMRISELLLKEELLAVRVLQVMDGSGVPDAAHVKSAVSPLCTYVSDSGCITISAISSREN